MCDFGATVGGSLGIIGDLANYGASKADWKSIVRAKQQEARNVTRAANYDIQDLEMSRQDNFEAAVAEVEKIRQNALGLNASVEASVTEGLGEGRTASLINHSVEGDEARAVASVQDNYRRLSNEVDLNQERVAMTANQTLAGITAPAKPSKTGLLLNMLNTGWNAYQGYADRRTTKKVDGVDGSTSKTGSGTSKSNTTTYYDMVKSGKWGSSSGSSVLNTLRKRGIWR